MMWPVALVLGIAETSVIAESPLGQRCSATLAISVICFDISDAIFSVWTPAPVRMRLSPCLPRPCQQRRLGVKPLQLARARG